MKYDSKCLPENIRRLMSPEDRQPLGKNARTMPEIDASNEFKSEKDLQLKIRQFLFLKDIVFVNPPMHKKTWLPEGYPDFMFAFRGVPIAFESKVGRNQQFDAQHAMEARLRANGVRYFVITSMDQVREILWAVENEQNEIR